MLLSADEGNLPGYSAGSECGRKLLGERRSAVRKGVLADLAGADLRKALSDLVESSMEVQPADRVVNLLRKAERAPQGPRIA
jgi:hypothetical protein